MTQVLIWIRTCPPLTLKVRGEDSAHNDLECCGNPSALLLSEPMDDLGTDAGKLWDPNQGSLRGLDGGYDNHDGDVSG